MDIFQLLKEHKEDIEIWKSIASIATPFITLFLGVWIAKKVENIKLYALKEKEWQVKWADMFLKDATEFNENISNLVCFMDNRFRNINRDYPINKITEYYVLLIRLDWNIKNYTQFANKYGEKVIEKINRIIELLEDLVNKKQDYIDEIEKLLETFNEIKKEQSEYNRLIRLAHSEILKASNSE